jgi:adenylylsulfate kinase-like enzyme
MPLIQTNTKSYPQLIVVTGHSGSGKTTLATSAAIVTGSVWYGM